MLLNLLSCFNKIKLFQFVDSLFQFCRIKKTRCKRSSSPTRTHLTRYDKCFLHSKSLVKTDHMVKSMLLSSQNDFLLHGFRDGQKLTFCLCEPWVTICKWFSVPLQDHSFSSVFEKLKTLNISVLNFFFEILKVSVFEIHSGFIYLLPKPKKSTSWQLTFTQSRVHLASSKGLIAFSTTNWKLLLFWLLSCRPFTKLRLPYIGRYSPSTFEILWACLLVRKILSWVSMLHRIIAKVSIGTG